MVGKFAGRAGLLVAVFSFSLLMLPLHAAGPDRTSSTTWPSGYVAPPGQEDLIVQVSRADGDQLDVSAKISLSTRQAAAAEVVATPQQHHRARFAKVPLGPARLKVTAAGYVTADLNVLLDRPEREMRVTIYLRPDGRTEASWTPALSASASSAYAKIVDSLRKGNTKEAEKYYAKLRKNLYGHPHVQYLAGLVDYHTKDLGLAVFHFSQAAYLNPEYEDSARALGGLFYHTGIYSDAYEIFSQLAKQHPEDGEFAWQAASAAFHAARYNDASTFAAQAAQQGGQTAGRAEILLALSDALTKKWTDAHRAANSYIAHGTDPALLLVAKDLINAMGPAESGGHAALPPERAEVAVLSSDTFDPKIPSRLWAPPDVDDQPPALIAGATCNLPQVLAAAGARVEERFSKLDEIGATQRIEQAAMDVTGKVMPLHHFTVDYLVDVHPMPGGNFAVDEFHGGIAPTPSPSNPPVPHGLSGLALVFNPAMQSDFTFECEGLTMWKGRPSWSVHFTELKDRPARLRAWNDAGRIFPVYVRGRGMVDQQTGEILRVETDIMDGVPELRLEEEHMVVDYAPVSFTGVDEQFYLPSEGEAFIHYHGRLYRIREDFNKYIRFTVDTKQEVRAPKGKDPSGDR